MSQRSEIRFLLNDQEVSIPEVGADDMLLDHLRLQRRLTGTKERCAAPQGRRSALPDRQCLHPISGDARRLPCRHRRISFRSRGSDASRSAGHGRTSRKPVRFLHAGLCHVALCALDGNNRSDRGADRDRVAGRSLPLHRLRADHPCSQGDQRIRQSCARHAER